MKVRNYYVGLVLIFFSITSALSQEKAISGTVSDPSGLPLPGATVLIKGTATGTATDFDGNYTINANQGDILVFSFVGYTTQEIGVGSSNTINVTLLESTEALEEVVVTAQGIKREKKALGYAVSTVEAESIEQRPDSDVARVLSGKIAGVNITSSNGMSGSSTNIIIRGYSSVTQSNQPLFVVDGIPFDSGTNTQSSFFDGSTESSRFLDLDPNSIESVSVLKGLSATVLYGSQGRNGVILITTKSANSGIVPKKTEITVSQSVFLADAIIPDYQNNYGGGFHQGFGFFFSNWGPRFDRTDDDGIANAGQYVSDAPNGNAILQHPFNYIGDTSLIAGYESLLTQPYEYKPYDGVKEFFRQGTVYSTSINIRGGSDKINYNANYGRTEDNGITRANKITRNTFSLGGNAQLSNKFSVSGVFNFTRTDYKSPPNIASGGSGPASGSAGGSGVFIDVMYTPRSVDLTNIPFEAADGRSVYYRSGNDIQNPYWTIKHAKTTQQTDRFNGNLNLMYDLSDWLNVTYRAGLDTYTELNTYGQDKGGVAGDATGIYRTIAVRNTIWNHDVIFNADKDLTEDLNLKVILGANANRIVYTQDGLESTGQLAFGVLKHYNFTTNSAVNSFSGLNIAFDSEANRLGVYMDATLGYKNYLYVNMVGRNDWSSTLESDNNSLFYPGASISFIPTTAFEELNSNILNYLKLRVGYGSSAGFPDPYFTRNVLGLTARSFVDNNGTVVSSNSVSNTLGNPDLKPETVQEFEVGLDSRLFKALNLNVSLYKKKTKDLITSQTLDDATGFTNTLVNIGEIESKGVEVDFDLDVIKSAESDGFRFNIAGNFAANESIVTDLADGTDNIALTDILVGAAANYAVEGRPFGVLLGSTILKDDNGNRVVGNDGFYLVDNSLSEIGDPNPDWTGALIPTFRYKNFTLSANVQYRQGGDIYSTTANALLGRGVVDYDDPINREANFILPGVDSNGNPNNVAITSTNLGFDNFFAGNIAELAVYDGTTIRLQELSLSYSMPESLLKNTPFGSFSLTLSGQNLWYKAVNFDGDLNYDTNSSSTGVGNGQGIDYITGPSSRRYGLSVKATF